MNNLAKRNNNDFTVLENGDAFISQRKAAELLGVSHTTIQNWVNIATLNVNKNKQLSHDSLLEVATRACAIGKPEAIKFTLTLAKAGAKAYIYHQAGYTLEAKNQPEFNIPKTLPEALRLAADQQEKINTQVKQIAFKDELIVASNEASIKAGEILVSEFCKSVDIIDIGATKFYEWMRDQGLLFKNSREPMQKYKDRGFFTWKPTEEKHGGKFRYTLRITPRGKVWLAARYLAYLDTGITE